MTGIIKTDKIQSSAGNDALTIVSSGNVGIKTTSPDSYYAKDLALKALDEGGITIAGNGANQQQYLMFADGTSGAERFRGYIGYDHNIDMMQMVSGGSTKFLVNNSAERMRVTNDGLTFNGDTAAANALDDYEEGTWTPAMSTANAHHSQVGIYTKIGRMVSLQMAIDFTQGGSTHGKINGLPFTPAGPSRITFTFREWYSTGITMSSNIVQGSTQTNDIVNYNNSGSSTNNQRYGFAMNCTYQVA